MPLIVCPDCASQVSDRAPACPKCGGPIASNAQVKAIGVSTVVQEQTAKSLKLHIALTSFAFFFCLIGLFVTGNILMGIGFVVTLIYLPILKFKQWWHHG